MEDEVDKQCRVTRRVKQDKDLVFIPIDGKCRIYYDRNEGAEQGELSRDSTVAGFIRVK